MKVADHDIAEAQQIIGFMYYHGYYVTQNYQKAFEWQIKAADQGHAKAQHNIGVMYFKGEYVDQNREKAVYWIRKSAKQSSQVSQDLLRQLGEAW